MHYSHARRLLPNLLGLVLLCGGLAGDWAVVDLVVTGASLYLLLLHIPAVFVWATGVHLVLKRDSYRVLTVRSRRIRVQGLSVAGLFVGLCTFPGLGVLTFSTAMLAANCMPRRRMPDLADELVPLPERGETLDPDVQPLIDVLYDSDTDTKRAAVTILSREHHANAMWLLRQFLSDPQPEIRRDASVALTQLENELFRELRSSFEQWIANPQDREQVLKLADQYASFARSNILDEMSQLIYLAKARDLLLQVLTQERTNAELWIKLARIRQGLGELQEALHDTRVALELEPASREAFVLAMDLAFCAHSWGDFVTFARDALTVLPDLPEAQAALQEWAALQPDLVGGGSHG